MAPSGTGNLKIQRSSFLSFCFLARRVSLDVGPFPEITSPLQCRYMAIFWISKAAIHAEFAALSLARLCLRCRYFIIGTAVRNGAKRNSVLQRKRSSMLDGLRGPMTLPQTVPLMSPGAGCVHSSSFTGTSHTVKQRFSVSWFWLFSLINGIPALA